MILPVTDCPTSLPRPSTPISVPRFSSIMATVHLKNRSAAAGLTPQIYVLNLAHGDFDNDGNADVVLLRGAWQSRARLSLLRNKGAGVFEDVTIASGLAEPLSTESAVWGDYDQDGRLDLFVCGEYHRDKPDPIDLSRLYHNEGNGKFKNVAEPAGIDIKQIAKGSAWGDYDGDGRLDLFVSVFDGACRLYHNEGNGTFKDVAPELGLTGPAHRHSFSCWFWDFDNDGRLGLLFVNDYHVFSADVLAYHFGMKEKDAGHPHLYRNLGEKGFRDVSVEVGLNAPIPAMGANFGDLDNDGFLDAYFGTGNMAYAGLIPNVMLKNVDGKHFEDISESSRTGHLQKGHGVSFADWDSDGDLDLFVVLGGGYPGDQSYYALFDNPGATATSVAQDQASRATKSNLPPRSGPGSRPSSKARTVHCARSIERSATTAASAETPGSS